LKLVRLTYNTSVGPKPVYINPMLVLEVLEATDTTALIAMAGHQAGNVYHRVVMGQAGVIAQMLSDEMNTIT